MQASAEISHKIRLAIKTKLTELGAYVDDELPDYVLVMVANRRGRADMKNELQLFLGEATERFCTWLFGVLDKLKETKNARRKADDETEKKQVDEDAELESYTDEESEEEKPPEKPAETKKGENQEKEKSVEKEEKSSKKPKSKISVIKKKSKSRSRSPRVSKMRMDRTPERKSERKRKSRSRSRSRGRRRRDRTPSRDRRRASRSESREVRKRKVKKDKKDKKSRDQSESPSRSRSKSRSKQKKTDDDLEKRQKALAKIKKSGSGLKSSIVVQKKEPELDEAEKRELERRINRGEKEKPIKSVKPTANIVVRAFKDAAGSSGSKNLSITRSITVKSNSKSEVKTEKPGSKRRSKNGKDEVENVVVSKKVKSDQRVFITKNTDDTEKKSKKSKSKKKVTSPKFFVTLEGKSNKTDSPTAVKTKETSKSNLIIPAATSDSDDDSKKIFTTNSAQEEAKKIKELQDQNPLPLINHKPPPHTLDLTEIESPDDPDARTIFVSNLSPLATENELKDHFQMCGTIVRVTVLRDHITQHPKGHAYIQFSTIENRKTALNFDYTQLYGQSIRVQPFNRSRQPTQKPWAGSAYVKPYSSYSTAQTHKYSFKANGGGNSRFTWTRSGYMPPR